MAKCKSTIQSIKNKCKKKKVHANKKIEFGIYSKPRNLTKSKLHRKVVGSWKKIKKGISQAADVTINITFKYNLINNLT